MQASMVAGRAEALGLRANSVDVAWLSTVLHHFGDPQACVSELQRVVNSGGVVLIRGMFVELGQLGWLPYFPDADAVREIFPSATKTTAMFEASGFELIGTLEVEGSDLSNAGEAVRWVRQMRHADTLLLAFSEAEYQAGLSALEAASPDQFLTDRLALLAFRKVSDRTVG